MDNLLWKTPDTWLLFVTYDYTHSIALCKSIEISFKCLDLNHLNQLTFTEVLHYAKNIEVRCKDD